MNRSPVLVVLTLAIASTGCFVDAQGRGAEGSFKRSFSVSGPLQLDVETGSGDIDIRTADTGAVVIEGRVTAGWRFWDGEDAEDRVRAVQQAPPIEQTGNDIRVGRGLRRNNVSISYLITVPRESRVRLRTGSGDVTVDDLQGPVTAQSGSGDIRIGRTDADVRARTGSGDIEVEAAAGETDINTGSGDVLMRLAGTGRGEIVTGSGDVEVDGASGPLRIRTGSGAIAVDGSPVAAWDLTAGSGDLTVEVPTGVAFDVNLRTSAGGIDAPAVVTSERATRRELRGHVGGGGPLVSMSTGSGEIRVR